MASSSAIEYLVDCARAIQDGDLKHADSLLEQILNLADVELNEGQSKVVRYIAEALVRRAYGLHPAASTNFTSHLSTPLVDLDEWYDYRSSVGHTIKNAVMGKKRLHLIDFYIPHLYGWGYLFCDLSQSSDYTLSSVRVSVILPPFLEKTVNLEQEKQYLIHEANDKELEFEELKVVYANNLGEVDASMLEFRRTKDEVVVIFYNYKLQTLLAEAGAMEREFLKLRQINPDTVIMLEQDADLNNSNFIQRLENSFQYYSQCFRLKNPEPWEGNYCRRQIGEIIGCEGRDRTVRPQTRAQWQSRLQIAGFLPIPLNLEGSIDNLSELKVEDGCLVLTRENHTILFVSAWKLEASEHQCLNPINDNVVPATGFNTTPPVEDTLQPLPLFSEDFSLNRLAVLVEIHDMLEDICLKYELPLALTWRHTNKIMPDPYNEHILSIEKSSCYMTDCHSYLFMKDCSSRYYSLRGRHIVEEVLQSNEPFLVEQLDGKLEQYVNPSMHPSFSPGAIVAARLQNHYDDVYVVQFFLPSSKSELKKPESLALDIVTDLENMKKMSVMLRFQGTKVEKMSVMLRFQGTKVGFQEEAISNIPQGEPRDGHDVLEIQGSNEQGIVIPNSQAPQPIRAPPAVGRGLFTRPNPMNYNGVLETPLHEQGNGKQTSSEALASDENETAKADESNLRNSSAKRRKLTSNVWEEFTKKEDEDGKEWAICNHCARKFDGSSKKGTTHLRKHLERCKSRPVKVRDQISSVRIGDSKIESVGQGNSSFDQERSRMDVARMIIKHQYPLNIVEHEFFGILLKNLQPMFKLQSQESLSADIIRVYNEEKRKLLEHFDKLSCRFSLTISVWENDLEKTTCYAVQFVDDNWKLKKKILALKNFGLEVDTKVFHENLKSVLMDWNFDKKVCSLIINSSSSSFEIAEEIRKNWLSFETSHPLSTFFISSDERTHGFLSKGNAGENDFNMLQNVAESIDGVIGTSNPYLVAILNIYKRLSQHERRVYPLMNVKSDDNNWRTSSLILAIAAILDPRFKFELVEFLYNTLYGNHVAKIHLTVIRNGVTDIFNEYARHMNNGTFLFDDTNSLTSLNGEESTIESFHRWYNSKSNVNIEASELENYLKEPIVSSTEFDLLGWWSEQASSFPILGRMARDILAIPIISSSTFSEKAMMDNPIFNGLDPEIIEAMICGRDWLESPKDCRPIVKSKNSSSLAHHLELEDFFSESDNEAPWNGDLRSEATTWTEKEVRTYLVFPFREKELKCLKKWKTHTINGECIGRDKLSGNALAPLLKIPPCDVDLRDPRNYYIDDTVVNQFFVLLKRRYERFPHKYLKHHSFDSSTTTFLMSRSKTESQVLNWVKEEDLKGVSKLFLPMCLHEHWLLFYADIDDKKLMWLDSNEHSQMSNVSEKQVILRWFLEFLLPLLGYDQKDWSFDVPKDIPLQKNSVDCALFVMKYADCLTHGNYFPFTQDDMPNFRHRIFLDLCRGSIRLGKSQSY